jgi:hypothetical protein
MELLQVLKMDEGSVQIIHLEGHRYTFVIVETDDGRRGLTDGGLVQEAQTAKHSGLYFRHDARRFAEKKARYANLID